MRQSFITCLFVAGCLSNSPVPLMQLPTPTPTLTEVTAPTSMATATPVAILLPTPTPKLTATPGPLSCAEQSMKFVAETNRLLHEWDAAVGLTVHTSRFQLPDRVDKLQALRTQAGELPRPNCAVQIKALLLYGMDSTIQSLMNFIEHGDVDVSWPEILRNSRHDIDAVRHALNATLEYSGNWQPMMIDDVKLMLICRCSYVRPCSVSGGVANHCTHSIYAASLLG
jgi:hypothetical protein